MRIFKIRNHSHLELFLFSTFTFVWGRRDTSSGTGHAPNSKKKPTNKQAAHTFKKNPPQKNHKVTLSARFVLVVFGRLVTDAKPKAETPLLFLTECDGKERDRWTLSRVKVVVIDGWLLVSTFACGNAMERPRRKPRRPKKKLENKKKQPRRLVSLLAFENSGSDVVVAVSRRLSAALSSSQWLSRPSRNAKEWRRRSALTGMGRESEAGDQ